MSEHAHYSKVTLAGHPVHPMLVAFPVAFYTATLLGYVAYAVTAEPFWYRLAFTANVAGVVMAAVAAIPGFIDWSIGIPSRSAAKADGLTHMLLNVAALLIFIVNLLFGYSGLQQATPRVLPPLLLSLLGVLLTVGAGWFGWRMVQVHHVGIQLPPPTPIEHEPWREHRARKIR
jgi:uncharacterized membrane protein